MCSAEKFGKASGEAMTSAIPPPIPHPPTRNFSPNKRQIRSAFEKGFLPFLPGSAQNIENDVTYSKQTIGEFLPGATTHISDFTFSQNSAMQTAPKFAALRSHRGVSSSGEKAKKDAGLKAPALHLNLRP